MPVPTSLGQHRPGQRSDQPAGAGGHQEEREEAAVEAGGQPVLEPGQRRDLLHRARQADDDEGQQRQRQHIGGAEDDETDGARGWRRRP